MRNLALLLLARYCKYLHPPQIQGQGENHFLVVIPTIVSTPKDQAPRPFCGPCYRTSLVIVNTTIDAIFDRFGDCVATGEGVLELSCHHVNARDKAITACNNAGEFILG